MSFLLVTTTPARTLPSLLLGTVQVFSDPFQNTRALPGWCEMKRAGRYILLC